MQSGKLAKAFSVFLFVNKLLVDLPNFVVLEGETVQLWIICFMTFAQKLNVFQLFDV